MSNKIVPNIYRTVIDDVIANIKHEFEEYGVAEDVLADLQAKWESKVIASHVADFEPNQAPPAPVQAQVSGAQPHTAFPMHILQTQYSAAPQMPYNGNTSTSNGQPQVKTEAQDMRYMLSAPYALPPLPGPQLNGGASSATNNRSTPAQPPPPHIGGQQGVLSFPPGPPPTLPSSGNGAGSPIGRAYVPPASSSTSQPSGGRIPQLDGPSSYDSDEDSPSPPPMPYAPRSSHPSLPQPVQQNSSGPRDDEAINSDLDDSDEEDEEAEDEGGVGETDIVFCTYDKVARVKNKWKCILKDGMIHVNGRDYLFQKCSGEFEW